VIIQTLLQNETLWAALAAWALAQLLKLPVHYLLEREVNWSLLLRAGGMPSSHSALISASAVSIGLNEGIDSAVFTISFVIAMIVIYDATGIRRQAGLHARAINLIIKDMVEGHPLRSRDKFIEVLGHSPKEAAMGVALGVSVSVIMFLL